MTINILLAGVGGQGLVLTTKLICDAGFLAGFSFKSNDVIGLSQRGGKVWGSVRIGEEVFSPNIPPREADFLLALEPLEGMRWSGMVKPKGTIIMNTSKIPPVPVMFEKAPYPEDIPEQLERDFKVIAFNGNEEGAKLGNSKVANTFLLGVLAKHIPEIPTDIWKKAIVENVPPKTVTLNLQAFEIGYGMGYNEA